MPHRIVERHFSDDEKCPSILIANIQGAPDVEENKKKMEEIIEIAHKKRVNIVIFPELALTGYVWESENPGEVKDLLLEGENNNLEGWLQNIRESLTEGEGKLEYVFFGNSRLKDGHLFNSTFILSPGIDYWEEKYIYDKVFLPPVEQQYFCQGSDKRLSIDTKWGRFGFLICYDLCFIELARKYAFIDGVDAIMTTAAWHSQAVREYSKMNVRTDHYYGYIWDLMNASKAAYHQIWSLGANWVGMHQVNQEYFWGGSGIWAPSGMPLLQASNINEEFLLIRNVNIKKQRAKEVDTFNYRIDFESFYRRMDYQNECIEYVE